MREKKFTKYLTKSAATHSPMCFTYSVSRNRQTEPLELIYNPGFTDVRGPAARSLVFLRLTHGINLMLMRRSNRNFNIPPPPPPGKPRAFELLKIGLFKFPPPRAKMVFKCPTLSSDLSVKSAPPKEQSSSAPVVTI